MARIVSKVRTIVSTDLDQIDRCGESNLPALDDTSQSRGETVFTILTAGGAYVTIAPPSGISRIGFLHIDTDAPILVRLNGVGDIPLSPLISPALAPGSPSPGPTIVPSVQKGIMSLRSGVSADGNTVSLVSVELRSPGSTAATVKVIFAGE